MRRAGPYETENADHSRVYTLYESGEAVTEMRKFSSTPDHVNVNSNVDE